MAVNLVCKLSGHQVNRQRVWEDGLNFRTSCARCGAALMRDDDISREDRRWREFDPDKDHDPRRKPHPRERKD